MKLLFDENLSPQLVRLLDDLFPDSVHVRDVGLKAADDPVVWKYAQDNALIICSKDSDMHNRRLKLVFKGAATRGSRRGPFQALLLTTVGQRTKTRFSQT